MEIGGLGPQGQQQLQQVQKDGANASLINQTMQNLNTQPNGSQNADFAFQTSVLNADTIGKGENLNTMV